MIGTVFLVDDEEHLRTACAQALDLADIPVETFPAADGVVEGIGRAWPGVVVTDIKMPGGSGLDLMAGIFAVDPEIPVILITGHGDVAMAVAAMRDGAYDFIEKPFPSDQMVDAVRRALEKRQLVLENRALRTALGARGGLEHTLVGRSAEMVRLRDNILDFARTDADVLILGETGAGKEMVARSLHEYSPRSEGRFVAINCGALPDTLIESELFGHKAGAFTGAGKARTGRIEFASGGTLFLDEIESMPLEVQVKMLRALQDRTVVPLGGNEEVPVDVRVIAATKEDLRDLADAGRFREDLYYRLDVLTLAVPPLRDRRDDIPLLFQHFVDQACRRYKRPETVPPPSAVASLMSKDWPGNVRELQNAAIRFALGAGGLGHGEAEGDDSSLASQMDAVEKQVIETALARYGGSLKATYEALAVSRKTLYDKMRKYGITVERGDG